MGGPWPPVLDIQPVLTNAIGAVRVAATRPLVIDDANLAPYCAKRAHRYCKCGTGDDGANPDRRGKAYLGGDQKDVLKTRPPVR